MKTNEKLLVIQGGEGLDTLCIEIRATREAVFVCMASLETGGACILVGIGRFISTTSKV